MSDWITIEICNNLSTKYCQKYFNYVTFCCITLNVACNAPQNVHLGSLQLCSHVACKTIFLTVHPVGDTERVQCVRLNPLPAPHF